MGSTDDIRNRYLDELLDSTEWLSTVDSAAVAEAWASSAVAEWAALEGTPGRLAALVADRSPLAGALIDWIEGGEPPEEGAEWVGDVGRHDLRRAMRLVDPSKPTEIGWILEYESPRGDRHDLSATILDDRLIGVAVGPPGLSLAAAEDQASGFLVDETGVDTALTTLRRCLDGGIDSLSEESEATLPLMARRLGVTATVVSTPQAERTLPDRDILDDRYAADLVASARRTGLQTSAPDAVHEAHRGFVTLVERGDADALTLLDIAGLDTVRAESISLEVFISLVGAYLAPARLDPHTDTQFEALVELEPADWVGVVLGMARAAIGTPIDGAVLVQLINRTPEITTTIPKNDAAKIAWTFEQMLYAWQVTGVLDDEGAVSAAAAWLLPQAALAAWRTPESAS